MTPLPDALIEADDGLVPVTVWLTPAQAARLELVVAHCRAESGADDNTVVDAIFAVGLTTAELEMHRNHKEPA